MDRVIGFMTYIGHDVLSEDQTVENFCENCDIKLRLTEGNVLTGIDMIVVNYLPETGLATVIFNRSISKSVAEALLSDDDLLIFGDFNNLNKDI